MKKLLVLDSNSILNRAFYGIRYLSASDGTQTNAVYGFVNILIKLVNEIEPDFICAAFDVKQPTFRHKMYDGYKAQRHPTPEALISQMPIAKDVLRCMGIPVLELPGYEADDIIGTVSKICEDTGVECFIATGDKDDLQLASDKTRVILTVTRNSQNETTVYDADEVYKTYGVTPEEFIDIKALMGDKSDNIPGVPGVGEKTATTLISKYHSIEYIYENIDTVDIKGAMLKKVTENKDLAFMSKTLATIVRDVPLEDFSVEKCVFEDFSKNDELYSMLKRLGLNSIIKRLDLDIKEECTEKKDIFENTQIVTIRDGGELAAVLAENTEIALVAKYDESGIISAAFAADGRAYSVSGIGGLNEIFRNTLERGRIIMNDAKDFIVKLSPYAKVSALVFDTAIAAYLNDPSEKSFDIKRLAEKYLGAEIELAAEEKQLSLFDDEDGENADTENMARQALALPMLKNVLEERLRENGQEKLYYDVELPLITVLAHMQINGFLVDAEVLADFSKMLSGEIEALKKEVYFLAGEEFNINSHRQLGTILFDKLALKPARKIKSGYSTNAEALERVRDKHPIINFVLKYRSYTKLKNTYCDGILPLVNPKTGRIHSVFTQTVTVTGRISSTEPNLQNIPARTELGREIRKMFVARDGYTLVDADYSQIELRVLAHIADDKIMQQAFLDGEDIHAVTASQVFGVPLSEVTKQQRSSAKAINFGIVYGMSDFSLANDLGISIPEAKAYIEGYLNHYSGVREYMDRIREQAKRDGFVKTEMNRIRYIPELKAPQAVTRKFGERVALNTPIQGTAADIIKLAMVRADRRLIREGLHSKLILQVHDELIVEARLDEVNKVKEILREEMQGAMTLKVPLTVDMSCGRSWYDAK